MTSSFARGFTLIELMVTVAVTAIVLMVAAPSFSELIQNNRLTTATNTLIASLGLARSEAVKQEIRIVVCKSASGSSCVGTGDWEQGWIVFTDPNGNSAYDSAAETLLRVQGAISGSVTMAGETSVANLISYVATGRSQQQGAIKVCDDRTANVGREIDLLNTGRARVESGVSCP